MNVGKICRVMQNFGYDDLRIVNPIAKLGPEAAKYAKHASSLIRNASIHSSFDEAIADCYPVIGTTSSLSKGRRDLNKAIPLSDLREVVASIENAAIVFGREDNGLPKSLLNRCDICSYIQTTDAYPSMNLSNAVAVFLHELRNMGMERRGNNIEADPGTMRALKSYFSNIVGLIPKGQLKNPSKCKKAFNNMLSRSKLNIEEARSIVCVLKEVEKRLSSSFNNLHSRRR